MSIKSKVGEMTPKEKAKELFSSLLKKIDPNFGILKKKESAYKAKQCAMICVDEIIKVASSYNDTQPENIYWKEVKTEIENL